MWWHWSTCLSRIKAARVVPGLCLNVEPDPDVAERLQKEEGDGGEEREEGEEVALGLLLDQGVVWPAVADHDDGQRRQGDVHNQVLVVRRLSADLDEVRNE